MGHQHDQFRQHLHLSHPHYPNLICFLIGLFLCACRPQPATNFTYITAIPTTDAQTLCQHLQTLDPLAHETRITIYQALIEQNIVACNPDEPAIHTQLQGAYAQYITLLLEQGDDQKAAAYIQKLNQPSPQLSQPDPIEAATCIGDHSIQPDSYTNPIQSTPLTLRDGNLFKANQPFPIYGVNYYPRSSPFHRFLRETNFTDIDTEFQLIQAAGINSLRFHIPESLFNCESGHFNVNADTLHQLDLLISAASRHGFYLIPIILSGNDTTLTIAPDFWNLQVNFLLDRYHAENTIAVWDLLEYHNQETDSDQQLALLTWINHINTRIRKKYPATLSLSSWMYNAHLAAFYNDFAGILLDDQPRGINHLAALSIQTNKPILVTSIGYSSFNYDETTQRDILYESLQTIENYPTQGWFVTSAFDYPIGVTCIEPNCPGQPSSINYFGLWNSSYFPKLSLEAVQAVINP